MYDLVVWYSSDLNVQNILHILKLTFSVCVETDDIDLWNEQTSISLTFSIQFSTKCFTSLYISQFHSIYVHIFTHPYIKNRPQGLVDPVLDFKLAFVGLRGCVQSQSCIQLSPIAYCDSSSDPRLWYKLRAVC